MVVRSGFLIGFGLICSLSLLSCFSDTNENDGCKIKDKKIAFQSSEAQYKKEVLENVANYTKLKNFIIANMDTIYTYNEKHSFVITLHEDGTADTVKDHLDHFAFFDYGTRNMIKDQVPPYLYPELKNIYTAFNKDNFYAVHFYKDSSISISITNPSEFDSNNTGIIHSLDWKKKVAYEKGGTSFSRDTTLANGWIYEVFIDCYQGR